MTAVLAIFALSVTETRNEIFSFSAILERSDLLSVRWDLWEISVLLLAFALSQFVRWSCLPYLLKVASSAGIHLSLLSADFYSVMAGICLLNYKVRIRH